jgi:hypothetical protein
MDAWTGDSPRRPARFPRDAIQDVSAAGARRPQFSKQRIQSQEKFFPTRDGAPVSFRPDAVENGKNGSKLS